MTDQSRYLKRETGREHWERDIFQDGAKRELSEPLPSFYRYVNSYRRKKSKSITGISLGTLLGRVLESLQRQRHVLLLHE